VAGRFVAVLFTDVVNSTGLTEAMGDAEWSRVRARHHVLVRECLRAHDGDEVRALGDGFLSRFASPRAAVRCAVSIQQRLDDQREVSGFAPPVRIGVHAGEAVHDGDDVTGMVVNIASRVMGEASGGEILITEAVAEHLDGAVALEDRGLRTLRGISRPRHLLAVAWRE
jgi:class 3 adenylate cyclase